MVWDSLAHNRLRKSAENYCFQRAVSVSLLLTWGTANFPKLLLPFSITYGPWRINLSDQGKRKEFEGENGTELLVLGTISKKSFY